MYLKKRLIRGMQLLVMLILLQWFSGGQAPRGQFIEKVRSYTHDIEFDYVSWTMDAFGVKLVQSALNTVDYISVREQRQAVIDYLETVYLIQVNEAVLNDIYADPAITDPDASSAELTQKLHPLYKKRDLYGPVAESVLQGMVGETLKSFGFDPTGQPIPPVLYRSTPLPWALIVSPRDVIRQDANISLKTEVTLQQQITLENQVDTGLEVSSLVVPVGGVGVYPTMVAQTTDLNWLAEVISHEWMHNYLTLRPLGLLYDHSPETRTMNETTANIAGKELGYALIERFFPEYLPPPQSEVADGEARPLEQSEEVVPPPFDFRAEMHETRVVVDEMLKKGQIEEAEEYMEQRRQYFWDNGYHIRKLNQAYFAFHGAYADEPLGAAGEDPVGAAVRKLRAASINLHDFIQRMAWLTSYQQLQKELGEIN